MARRKAAPAEEPIEIVVTPEPFVEDEWETNGGSIVDEETTPRTRKGSALVQATREFEIAHKAADKARARIAKVQPLIDSLNELEKAEQDAYAALHEQLGSLGA